MCGVGWGGQQVLAAWDPNWSLEVRAEAPLFPFFEDIASSGWSRGVGGGEGGGEAALHPAGLRVRVRCA